MNVLFLKPLKYLKLEIGEPRSRKQKLQVIKLEDRTTKISMERNR